MWLEVFDTLAGCADFYATKSLLMLQELQMLTGPYVFRVAAGAERMLRVLFCRKVKKSRKNSEKINISLTNQTMSVLGNALVQFFPDMWSLCKKHFPTYFQNIDWPLVDINGDKFNLELRHLDSALCIASRFWDIATKQKKKKLTKFYDPALFALTAQQIRALESE